MCKIVLAERDEIISLFYEVELSEMGYDVVTVNCSDDFLETVILHRPDLLLMCNRMALKNGLWRTLSALRRDKVLLCPVIICSDRLPVPDALERLADRVLLKSRDLQPLKWTLREFLSAGSENHQPWDLSNNIGVRKWNAGPVNGPNTRFQKGGKEPAP